MPYFELRRKHTCQPVVLHPYSALCAAGAASCRASQLGPAFGRLTYAITARRALAAATARVRGKFQTWNQERLYLDLQFSGSAGTGISS